MCIWLWSDQEKCRERISRIHRLNPTDHPPSPLQFSERIWIERIRIHFDIFAHENGSLKNSIYRTFSKYSIDLFVACRSVSCSFKTCDDHQLNEEGPRENAQT
jgi:tRNA/tmRNA/rRNA uracil-C5-methylase (TrmA/RlmC/RlmD family)